MAEDTVILRPEVLRQEVKQVVVPQVTGIPFYADTIPEAQRLALAYNQETGGFTAPMPLLLVNFPHSEWYTANSEDLSGVANYDMPHLNIRKGEAFVATAHGGTDGKVGILLTPDKTELALQLWKETEENKQRKGLNAMHAAVLDDIYYGKDVLSVLLNERRAPDNRAIGIYSYEQMLAGETPKDFSPYVVVRPLALARQTIYGYESIDRLTNIAELVERDGLSDEESFEQERVTDSQVIVYAGGVAEGNKVIRSARYKFTSGKLGVWHPFNVDTFNPEQSQGRLLFLGKYDDSGFGGDDLLDNDGHFVGGSIAPEALRENGASPDIEDVLGRLTHLLAPAVIDQAREALAPLYTK